jgi:acyl-CoA reductase-like NAD-dependent aldehyde dehydrogenase
MHAVPRVRPTSPIGLALTAFHLWRRLPPAQRQQVMRAARQHGPKVAAAVLARRKAKP